MPRPQNPDDAILSDSQVPEERRFCASRSCRQPVGRSRDGYPGLAEGFCPACGTPFSFSPKLAPGELVNDQYEVRGCINFGGFGWIYLAKDLRVGFDVVLKGLIHASDADDRIAMEEELEVLAQVNHPSIVTIYNFVKHPDRHSDATIGYIVEEYVAGSSLADLRVAEVEPGESEPLPLQQVIACTLEILPALGYLHSNGWVYCDLKPDNIIQTEDRLKLVDLGAVRKADDTYRTVYGTRGYQAPELARGSLPSVPSDLYTVGRTMAVLSFDFFGVTTTYAEALPEPQEVPLLGEQDSYYRFLRRATDPDPERRFASAEEMSDQLKGVYREVLARQEGQPYPEPSSLFGPETPTFGIETSNVEGDPVAATTGAPIALPAPQMDPTDPAASLLGSLTTVEPAQVLVQLRSARKATVELRLRLARTLIELGDLSAAGGELDDLDTMVRDTDWRVGWYRGVLALAAGEPAETHFDAIYSWLPGEAAPKLALAVAEERASELAVSEEGERLAKLAASAGHYEQVWSTDHSYVSAAFGLARTQLARGNPAAAIEALDAVPQASIHYIAARTMALRVHLYRPADLTADALERADSRIRHLEEDLSLDPEQREELSIELFQAALDWIGAGHGSSARGMPDPRRRVRGRPLRERDLRFGMESSYRTLAHLAGDRDKRYALVDRANFIRPTTWV